MIMIDNDEYVIYIEKSNFFKSLENIVYNFEMFDSLNEN